MSRVNTRPRTTIRTHEGAPAKRISAEQQLERSVLSCFLWEREFYEDGVDISKRIFDTALQCESAFIGALAQRARYEAHLRHVSLLLLTALARRGSGTDGIADITANVIGRADEIAEFMAIYAKMNQQPVDKLVPSAQMKRGLSRAFQKFDAYQLAKYDRAGEIRLRDVAMLVHARAKDMDHGRLMASLVNRTFYPERTKSSGFPVKATYGLGDYEPLAAPDTWEVGLSTGGDKRETFMRLLRDNKLGYLALLRNLRNMAEAGVDEDLIKQAIVARRGARHVLPFRYVAAARAVPRFEPELDTALGKAIEDLPAFGGKTIVLVDVSLSMDARLSARSDLSRMDAAAALAAVFPAESLRVFSFSAGGRRFFGQGASHKLLVEVPPRRGMAGIEAVVNSQVHGGTMLGQAIKDANQVPHDRLVVITDEQSEDRVPDPVAKKAYMINVASARNGVGYHRWTHVDGFSESVLRFMNAYEQGFQGAFAG